MSSNPLALIFKLNAIQIEINLIHFNGGMVAGHFLLTDGLIKNVGVPMGANVVPKGEQNLARDYFVGCMVAGTKE
jgi:hypothetical protein